MRYVTMIWVAVVLAGAPVIAQGQAPRRARLEQRYRALGEKIVRKRLNLSDDQMQKLRQVNSRFSGQRRSLVQQQKDVQLALRDELSKGKSVDQRHVAQLNGRLNTLMKQRFELQEQERGELSKFLSPVQQAQYQGLQAQIRQKVRTMQGQAPPGELSPEEPGPSAP